MNDSDKFSERIRWIENIFNRDERNFKYLFWFLSLLTIPVFAYLYSFPITLFLWGISEIFGLSENSIDILTKFELIICFIFAFGTQFHLWKMYKIKKGSRDTPIT
ncbi:hypothetical protein C6A37_03870 [Desulfobacteraceae bacterium SEEP-SAG9]|nr:hypothetical protein C6A37_03870 [Desulfobacteraceae bacterium SEEP-SAG9]